MGAGGRRGEASGVASGAVTEEASGVVKDGASEVTKPVTAAAKASEAPEVGEASVGDVVLEAVEGEALVALAAAVEVGPALEALAAVVSSEASEQEVERATTTPWGC